MINIKNINNYNYTNQLRKVEFDQTQQILERNHIANEIKSILDNFDENCKNINFKKGIYIYGSPGCGKTDFIINLLKEWNYDIIKYDAGDVRNKTLIDTITSNNIANKNVLELMNRRVRRIVIIMDEVDGMNSGDKGGITSLIKLIRQKKTKKQRTEDVTLNPIICIGNYFMDKKIRELMKVCNVFELKTPTNTQISMLIDQFYPQHGTLVHSSDGGPCDGAPQERSHEGGCGRTESGHIKTQMIKYIQGDLRKLQFIKTLYEKKPNIFREHPLIFQNVLRTKTQIEDSKRTTQLLLERPIPIEKHNEFMNETDRTIVALLWHENVVDALEGFPKNNAFPFYSKILDNMCYADYIDRITFQNQIWQFNEMSSMMKTFYNNKLFHDYFPKHNVPNDVRFTKVLTKYSTEYNNQLFISIICRELDMDKKDAIALFQEIRLIHGNDFLSRQDLSTKIDELLENLHINKLDMKRIYRYLDKNVKKDATIEEDIEDDLG